MERRSSLGGHLSLSTSNIASPLAESTQINGSSLHSGFPWGGKMSPAKGPAGTSNGSILLKSAPKVASPMRKIDPRVYTDVQSKGLASRIVKYHENSSKLNRSMSMGNLYNKPGQFPVVHLKKTEVQVSPRRTPSLSTVRIAPPEKSLYQASTRSSIFRTGSITPAVIGTVQTDERESCDNRPIVPPAENDVNPTRSVLDALKEISRKRINSDDVDCNDSIKKYCKESDEDPRRRLHLPVHNLSSTSQQVSVITKRQRELPASPESKPSSPDSTGQKKRPCTKNNDISSSLSSSLSINTPKRKLQDIQGRPPIGRYSPSSSNFAPPRAKQHCNDRNYVIISNSVQEDDLKYPPDQLTPIPPTPAVESAPLQSLPKTTKSVAQKPKLTLFNKDYDTAEVIRREDKEPEEEGIAGISFIKPKKHSPTVTGKNALIERVQSSKLSLMLSCLSGELNDSDDEVGKKVEEAPETATALATTVVSSTSSSTTTTSTVASTGATSTAPTNISSASLTVTSSAPSTTSAPTSAASATAIIFGPKPVESIGSSASISSAVTSGDSGKVSETAPKPAFSFGNITTTRPNETTATTPAVSAATSNTGFSLSSQPKLTFGSPQASAGLSFPTTATSAAVSTATSVVTSTAPAPTGGLTFGSQNPAASNTASATTLTSSGAAATATSGSNTSLFSFGSTNAKQPNVAPAFSTTSSSLSFSAPKTSENATFTQSALTFGSPAITQSQSKPLFSFGATQAITATTSATSVPSSGSSFGSTVSKPLALFGSSTTTTSSTTPSIPAFGSQHQTSVPSFGSVGSSAFSPAASAGKPSNFGETGNTFSSPAALSSSNSGGFNFGGSQQPAPTAGAGLFGQAAGNSMATTTANSSFSFGSSSASKPSFNFTTPSTSNSTPAFGLAPAVTTAAPTNQTSFGFGNAVASATQPPTTQSTPFSFGGAGGQQPQGASTGFNFGGSAVAPNSSPFTFGGAATTTPAQPQVTKSFSFGGGTAPSAFTTVSNNKPAAGGFSFNAPTATAPANKNLFGSAASEPAKPFAFSASTATKSDPQQPPPAFGSSASQNTAVPAFGSSASQNTAVPAFGSSASQNTTVPTFGSSASQNTAVPAFGSSASQNTAVPAFGAPSMTPGKLFTFGGAPANNNAAVGNAPGTNLFGSPAVNNSSSSLFPSASNANPSPFGSAPTATAKPSGPVFAFGANSNTNNNANPAANNAPFAFGSSAPQAESSKPFTFGAATQPAQQTGNIFGSSSVNKASAFNFSATVAGTSAPDAMNNNPLAAVANPFNPTGSGTDTTSLPRREIRTATRRLKPK